MGKRKHRDRDSRIRKKIRRLEERLRHNLPDSSEESYRSEDSRYDSGSQPPEEYYHAPFSDGSEDLDTMLPRSAVVVPSAETTAQPGCSSAGNNNAPITSEGVANGVSLSDDILAALGDPQGKDEKLGPKIQEELSERWGKVIVDGLTKEQRQDILEKALIPENFLLLKAPQLNPEITPVLSETAKNRDKSIEKIQQHLGVGMAALSNLTSQVIKEDVEKIEMLKNLSQVSQILLDLHYECTMHRRKLVASNLDKTFNNIVKDVKRDAYLFGANLGEKIKTSKTAERSGLQVRRGDGNGTISSRKYNHRENWRGPPRRQSQRPRRGGPRNRYYNQRSYRRPPPVADRPPITPKLEKFKNPKT